LGLFALFYVDELRRLATETVIPKILKFFKNKNNLKISKRKKSDDPALNMDAYVKVIYII
jgi:hypothetical protein